MTHQRVNMRTSSGAHMFGDERSRELYETECETARAAQKVRYAVAPRQSVTTHDGRVLNAGEELRPERDLRLRVEKQRYENSTLTLPVWQQVERLVLQGVVLEADIPDPAPGPVAA